MPDETRKLRAAIAALPTRRRRFPPALRASLRAYVKREVAGGASRSRVAASLGVSQPTVSRLLAEESSATLVPIVVVYEQPPRAPKGIVVRGPRGLLIENLDVDGLAALIRALS